MKTLTILVDMDGTIEKLLDVWLYRLNTKFGTNVTCEDVTDWDVSKAFPTLNRKDVFDVLMDDTIWCEIEPIDDAPTVLEGFIRDGHKVYIVTATPYESIPAKMNDLLFRLFPFLSWENVIVASRKQLILGDVLIDDGAHNLIGGPYKKLLYDAPYNRNINDEEHEIIRVHNWNEIRDVVSKMASDEA